MFEQNFKNWLQKESLEECRNEYIVLVDQLKELEKSKTLLVSVRIILRENPDLLITFLEEGLVEEHSKAIYEILWFYIKNNQFYAALYVMQTSFYNKGDARHEKLENKILKMLNNFYNDKKFESFAFFMNYGLFLDLIARRNKPLFDKIKTNKLYWDRYMQYKIKSF